MDKIERLIQMMEQPDSYSKEEWQNVLADKDCREYYQLMCDTAAALHNPHTYNQSPDETETEAALQRFQQRYMPANRHLTLWRQVAAVFIGLIFVSGLAFAAVAIVKHQQQTVRKEVVVRSTKKAATTKSMTASRDTLKSQPQPSTGTKQFVNAPVSNILDEMAHYYGLKVEVRSTEASRIRLYFNWNKQYDAAQVVEQLNQFEHIHVTLDGDALILEETGGTDR